MSTINSKASKKHTHAPPVRHAKQDPAGAINLDSNFTGGIVYIRKSDMKKFCLCVEIN